MKLRYSKKLFRRSSSKSSTASSSCCSSDGGDVGGRGEIEWEVRPGGMLVQKRDGRGDAEVITVRVATGFSWHDVSIGATCTFGKCYCVSGVQTFCCSCSFGRANSLLELCLKRLFSLANSLNFFSFTHHIESHILLQHLIKYDNFFIF